MAAGHETGPQFRARLPLLPPAECDWCGKPGQLQACTLWAPRVDRDGQPILRRTDQVCAQCLATVADCPECHQLFVPHRGPPEDWHPNTWTYWRWDERRGYRVECPSCRAVSDAEAAGLEAPE